MGSVGPTLSSEKSPALADEPKLKRFRRFDLQARETFVAPPKKRRVNIAMLCISGNQLRLYDAREPAIMLR